ncbi:MAG: ImmA/IrrE family metallo-endopeptidase [Chromatiaceae bacterium]
MAIRPSRDKTETPGYQLRLNATHEPDVQFVTLVHELGHLFLGHLGPDAYLRIAERPRPPHGQRELEAESLAYLVCKRHGVTSKSESYLAHYVATHTTVDAVDLDIQLKAAGQVERFLCISAGSFSGSQDA